MIFFKMLHLMSYNFVLIITSIIWTVFPSICQKLIHLIFVQIHAANIAFIIFIIFIIKTSITYAHFLSLFLIFYFRYNRSCSKDYNRIFFLFCLFHSFFYGIRPCSFYSHFFQTILLPLSKNIMWILRFC